jgi:hypothetical protein
MHGGFRRLRASKWLLGLAVAAATVPLLLRRLVRALARPPLDGPPAPPDGEAGGPPAPARPRVAFIGNSVLYFNDLPRLLEALAAGGPHALGGTDSCLRGGASLKRLLDAGNGMGEKFATPSARRADGTYDVGAPTVGALLASAWDYVVLNDYTQAPARPASRAEGLDALVHRYAPLLAAAGAAPVLLQTWAYRAPAKGSDDLGGAAAFGAALREGYAAYAAGLARALPPASAPRIAPVGGAFEAVRARRPALWAELFQPDDFHPSPHGTYLAACVVYIALFGAPPPEASALPVDPARLWARARRMQPPHKPPLRLPTRAELAYLRKVAIGACAAEPPTAWAAA